MSVCLSLYLSLLLLLAYVHHAHARCSAHRAREEGVRITVINYADLLWRPQSVSMQLKELLPCIAEHGFDPTFKPKMGQDVFEFNRFKEVNTTVVEYGAAHPPSTMGYSVEQHCCTDQAEDGGLLSGIANLPEIQPMLARYAAAEAVLKNANPSKGKLELKRCTTTGI